jgi:hypothetical protein
LPRAREANVKSSAPLEKNRSQVEPRQVSCDKAYQALLHPDHWMTWYRLSLRWRRDFYSGLFFHLRTTHVRVTPHRAILQIAGEGGSRPATSAYHPFF